VPVVIAPVDYQEEFAADYGLIAAHVATHYREVGTVAVYGTPYVRVFVENSRHPHRTDPVLGFPCFR
jgi:hypothetical protein